MQTAQNNIIPVHSHFQGKFNTATGRLIDLKDPTPEMFHVEDIATALSRICRFGGHSSAFYSVAQHSVMVAAMAEPYAKAWALMHDAAEAYLGDVIKPLKVLIEPHYGPIERAFERVIRQAYDIRYDAVIAANVKDCDIALLEIEHEALILGRPARYHALLQGIGWDIPENGRWAWEAEMAKEIFLSTFTEIFW